jgi:co-chaperonin GroES (HSP10)
MSYSDFNLSQINKIFGVNIDEKLGIFTNIKITEIDPFFIKYLQNNIPLAQSIGTEKAKSEMIIAPVLIEVRRILDNKISLFSGIDFNVDPEHGLNGFCDFLISLSPQQLYVTSPIITLVEAKNDNLKSGIAQCIAEMIAAAKLNQQEDNQIQQIYGCVTNGNQWLFMKLENNQVTVDLSEYYINEPEKIISIFVKIITAELNL